MPKSFAALFFVCSLVACGDDSMGIGDGGGIEDASTFMDRDASMDDAGALMDAAVSSRELEDYCEIVHRCTDIAISDCIAGERRAREQFGGMCALESDRLRRCAIGQDSCDLEAVATACDSEVRSLEECTCHARDGMICGTECKLVNEDPNNCGGCGNRCPFGCSAGECASARTCSRESDFGPGTCEEIQISPSQSCSEIGFAFEEACEGGARCVCRLIDRIVYGYTDFVCDNPNARETCDALGGAFELL